MADHSMRTPAHVPPPSPGAPDLTDLPEPVRGFLAALTEALTLPDPDVTNADERLHARQLGQRISFVQDAIEDVLNGKATLGLDWETDYLRKYIAKSPAAYRTRDGEEAGQ